LEHHILAIDNNGGAPGRAQRHVQHRAVLRDVDLVAAKHSFHPRPHPRFFGQLDQELHGLIGNEVFRIVEENTRGLDRHALAALRIVGKKIPQVHCANLLVMSQEFLPAFPLCERFGSLNGCRHSRIVLNGRPAPRSGTR
jgi:hypothetical protein